MAGPWEKYAAPAPTEPAPVATTPKPWEKYGYGGQKSKSILDYAKGGLDALTSGVANATFALPGMPADIDQSIASGANTVANMSRRMLDMPELTQEELHQPLMPGLPGGEEWQQSFNRALGTTPYKPQNPVEEGLNTIGSFIPGVAAFGGVGAGAKQGFKEAARHAGKAIMQQAVIPGVLTEGAGQAARTLSPENEKLARGLTAVGSSIRGITKTAPRSVGATDEALQNKTNALYGAAHREGLTVSDEGYMNLASQVEDASGLKGRNPKIMPRSGAMLEDILGRVGETRTLQQIDDDRQLLGKLIRGNDAGEAHTAQQMADKLDDFMDDLENHPEWVDAGDPKRAMELIKEARQTYRMRRKGEEIQDIIDRAHNSQKAARGNIDEAIVDQFRTLLNNKKRMRQFDKFERRAIHDIVHRNKTERVGRFLASFDPEVRSRGLFAGGLGYLIGGPAGALIGPAIGKFGQSVTGEATENAAGNIANMVRGGKRPNKRRLLPMSVFQTGNMAAQPPGTGGGGF